ncbi:MAG: hypothetical protein KDN22_20790 [Verrucomicrobiae bacterium]|nr:hypothetical protein [Verrucomicrobiae bacterium]
MKIWIRHLDGNVEDFGTATEAEAVERFRLHDWDAELADYDSEKDGLDHCLPSFGMVDGEQASCDLTPFDEESCKVNFYFHKPGKLFGIFPIKKNVWQHLPRYPRTSFEKVVRLFYARDIEGLCQLIAREKGISA